MKSFIQRPVNSQVVVEIPLSVGDLAQEVTEDSGFWETSIPDRNREGMKRMEKVPPPISVLICTRNRADELIKIALPSVLQQDYPDYEIIVVDQSTNDDSQNGIATHFRHDSRIRYIRTATKGLSISRNLALTLARHELCAFTDDDCQVHPHWLSNIANLYARHPETQVSFSPVHIPPDAQDKGDVVFPSFYFEDDRILKYGEIMGMGANMALRKSSWIKIGPFDTLLGVGGPFPGGEEHDWLYRAHRLGTTIRLEPQNSIYHWSWRSRKDWNRVLKSYGAGDAGFAMKHLRCGDLSMMWTVIRTLVYMSLRGVLRIIQGKRNFEEFCYVQGYFKGIIDSLKFPVQRQTRLYSSQTVAPPPLEA